MGAIWLQIVVLNTCVVCGLGEKYEHGCYPLDLLPNWVVNEGAASELCPSDSLTRLFIIHFLVEVQGVVMTCCSQGRTIGMGTLSKSV